MHELLKLSHHHHSGRHRPHEHTSYLPLIAILLLTGGILALSTFTIHAASPGPEAESVGLSGEMPGPPPQDPAAITSPNDQDRFDTSPITVEGTCPDDSLVEILNNNIFAGSALCSNDNTFSLDVGLLIGENQLRARVYDSLNQSGPNSEAITVFYDALPPQEEPLPSSETGNNQLLLNTDIVYRGNFPDETLTMPVEIIDGTPPFALDVNWGDNNEETIPRDNNQPFRINHVYTRPGTYEVDLQVTDSEQRIAHLSTVVIINGRPPELPAGGVGASGTTGGESPLMSIVYLLWPIFAAILAMVLSFWMGERREKRILADRGLLLNNSA